jgi:hypothetical protein
VESESSDDQEASRLVEPQNAPIAVPNDENQNPNLILIDDSDDDSDSSDSMYIAASRPRDEVQDQHIEPNAAPLQPQLRNVRQRRDVVNDAMPSPQRQRQQPPASLRRSAQHQQPLPSQHRHNRQSRASSLIDEADSTSESESSALSADESDENAADLYRNAIMGVRNRPNAVRQVS